MTPAKDGHMSAGPASSPVIKRKSGFQSDGTVKDGGPGENSVKAALGKAGVFGVLISGFGNGQANRKMLPANMICSVEDIENCQVGNFI